MPYGVRSKATIRPKAPSVTRRESPWRRVVVTLGNTCRHLDAAELQTRAIAMLDQRE